MIRSLLLVLICATTLTAQHQSALYKIEGNGLNEPSYLFGTINFLPKFGYFVPDEVKNAIIASRVFVTKTDLRRKTQQKFTEAVKIPNDGTVNKYLTEEEQKQLRAIIEEYGGRNQAYDNFYSKLQPIILVTATTALTLQYNITYPERELEDIAKDNRLKFNSLSDVDEEIAAFEQFPIEDQIEALKYTINNFDDHLSDYNKMVRAYMKEQNMEVVKEETFKATNESEKFKEVYYDNRTEKWLPDVVKLIKSKPTFFALGVPHIIGESGLVSLLEKEGYTITPVIIDFAPAKTSN
ncbi:TraB/GumN family protein [Fulvivirga lutea]|uniref:TraB/GumN family protein n=1 Tax=Fulvivirga lutea TaxID=2810512 RepID=A0A974WIP5_9BACT|nr:TraB/GumN family protein [Fulvivirga lutea]QSE98483.1 TraB/GumN family protein [Fulvivirga lutea]